MTMDPPFFIVPFLFHHDVKMRINTLNHLNSIFENNTSQKFPIFFLLLYILRNDVSSLVHLHILYHSLPSLISTNDPAISKKILEITKSFIHEDDDNKKQKLHVVGIRMLHKLWINQKRLWIPLRSIIVEWVKKRKLVVDENYLSNEKFELEIAVLSTIRLFLFLFTILFPI